jgi:hypothetical protein
LLQAVGLGLPCPACCLLTGRLCALVGTSQAAAASAARLWGACSHLQQQQQQQQLLLLHLHLAPAAALHQLALVLLIPQLASAAASLKVLQAPGHYQPPAAR